MYVAIWYSYVQEREHERIKFIEIEITVHICPSIFVNTFHHYDI